MSCFQRAAEKAKTVLKNVALSAGLFKKTSSTNEPRTFSSKFLLKKKQNAYALDLLIDFISLFYTVVPPRRLIYELSSYGKRANALDFGTYRDLFFGVELKTDESIHNYLGSIEPVTEDVDGKVLERSGKDFYKKDELMSMDKFTGIPNKLADVDCPISVDAFDAQIYADFLFNAGPQEYFLMGEYRKLRIEAVMKENNLIDENGDANFLSNDNLKQSLGHFHELSPTSQKSEGDLRVPQTKRLNVFANKRVLSYEKEKTLMSLNNARISNHKSINSNSNDLLSDGIDLSKISPKALSRVLVC